MRHLKDTLKLGRREGHRKALLANQVSSLVLSGQIKTTVEKAKATKRLAERMVTLAKKGTLHHRRLAIARIRNQEAVRKLFNEIAANFADRKGGYTRIIRLGTRRGDAAETCLLQWVNETYTPPKKKKSASKEETETKNSSGETSKVEETTAAQTAV